jgi:hypothetical protein
VLEVHAAVIEVVVVIDHRARCLSACAATRALMRASFSCLAHVGPQKCVTFMATGLRKSDPHRRHGRSSSRRYGPLHRSVPPVASRVSRGSCTR